MYLVTITERTPRPPEEKDINTYTIRMDSMFEVLDLLRDAELSWTCWVNVNITYV